MTKVKEISVFGVLVQEVTKEKHPTTGELIEEKWVGFPEFERHYAISNYGRVISLPRVINRQGKKYPVKGRLRKLQPHDTIYQAVNVVGDGRSKLRPIHRMVALAFIPNPENKPCVNHIIPAPSNNYAWNLEWVSHKENLDHAINNGLFDPYFRRRESNWTTIKCAVCGKEIYALKSEHRKYCSKKCYQSVLRIKN